MTLLLVTALVFALIFAFLHFHPMGLGKEGDLLLEELELGRPLSSSGFARLDAQAHERGSSLEIIRDWLHMVMLDCDLHVRRCRSLYQAQWMKFAAVWSLSVLALLVTSASFVYHWLAALVMLDGLFLGFATRSLLPRHWFFHGGLTSFGQSWLYAYVIDEGGEALPDHERWLRLKEQDWQLGITRQAERRNLLKAMTNRRSLLLKQDMQRFQTLQPVIEFGALAVPPASFLLYCNKSTLAPIIAIIL